jgi:hypothetical protein
MRNTEHKDRLLKQKEQGKDTGIQRVNQLDLVRKAFFMQPCTMLMAAHDTGVERAGICRYVATMFKQKEIAIIKKTYCVITNHRAGYYTTDKNLFPKQPEQGKLFEL